MIKKMTRISVIGVGGIGSNLAVSVASAISSGPLVRSLGGISLNIIDSDKVEERNLMMGQRFSHSDMGKDKVIAVRDAISGFEGELFEVNPIPNDVRELSDVPDSDIAIVCVDNMDARRVVHGLDIPWLDLRCSGDGYIAIDFRVRRDVVKSLTREQHGPRSCQLEGWESGFLQAGYLAAATHGFQWVIAALRQRGREAKSILPRPRSSSVTFGMLGELPTGEVMKNG
jgi:hypothetical protein